MEKQVPPTIHHSSPIPRRALVAVAGTVLTLALLVSFRTPDTLPITAGGRAPVVPVPSPSVVAVAPASGGNGRSGLAVAGPTAAPRGTAFRTAAPTPVSASPLTSTAAASATPGAPATGAASGDATGSTERTPFGNVQVEVKISGGKIVDVIAIQLPHDRRRSVQISSYVAPILHDEALQAQSAQIDLISGATWTSGAYQTSLQAALDQIAHG